jgi:myosin-7
MRRAMQVLKFGPDEIENIFRTTAAVLHIGNVEFIAQGEKAAVKDIRVVQVAADLLGADVKETESALISQVKQMGRESVLTFRNQTQAEAGRDALCKAIYGHLFNWLIERINKALVTKIKIHKTVGVLDIFGFEIFATNRFEQFCINFANEKMQQHFNWYIFTMEQEEYAKEKIDVAHVQHLDNQKCLDMIETGKNCILAMADEEIKLPKGSDENLLQRLHNQFGKGIEYYVKPKTNQPIFGINHYAGLVDYKVEGFMEKNKDALEVNIAGVCQHSKSNFVASLVPVDQGKISLGFQFKSQLTTLMNTLKATQPHFIRCIKSNMLKIADTFDGMLVLRQLRYLGLKEVVNIRQLGYPVRKPHTAFYKRYKVLAPEADPGYY